MGGMKSLLCAMTLACLPISANADNKVVVIPLGADAGPGNWKSVSVSSLGGVVRDTSVTTKQAINKCGFSIGRYTDSSAAEFLTVPVQLPDGATITGFTGIYCDQTALYKGEMYFYRSDGTSLAYTSSGLANNSAELTTTVDNIIPADRSVVDNSQYSYYIYMSISGDAGDSLVPISGIVTLR